MFVRFFYSPADGGSAPVGGAAPAAGTTAPAAAGGAAPAAPDIQAIVAEAVKAAVAPIIAENQALKEKADTAEKEKTSATAQKATAEETMKAEIKRLRERYNESESAKAVQESLNRYQYASPQHRDMALAAFKASHPVEVSDKGDVLAGGKPIGKAFEDWFAANGSIFKAAAAQPGPGTPAATGPQGIATKPLRQMSDAEFADWRRTATITGSLVPGGEKLTIKPAYDPMRERREAILGRMGGANHGTIHK